MKSILFINGTYPNYGGTEKVTTILANHFSKKGYHVSIASFQHPQMELMAELSKNVSFYALSLPVISANNIKNLSEIVSKSHVDIIINQWCLPFFTNRLCRKAIRGSNCKIISVLHGVPNKSKKVLVEEEKLREAKNIISFLYAKVRLIVANQIIKASIRYVYRNSDKYVVLSKGFIDVFMAYTKLKDTTKLSYIGNPITIPTDYANDFISNKQNNILYVGRMDMINKRVDRIIKVWENIANKYLDWNLILIGDGPDRQKLESYVNERNIQRVHFGGFIKDEPIKYYKESSILLLTSDLEGFGLVVTEAMSYGVVPVVYGSYVSIYDIISNGKDGYITSFPYSHEETTRRVEELIKDEKLRMKMASDAIEKSKSFNLESIYKKWENLFDNL